MAADPQPSLDTLSTEGRSPRTVDIDMWKPLQIATVMNEEDSTVAEAVHEELPNIGRAMEGIADRLRAGGRLIYVGAGTSGRLGVLDASECPPTFSTPPEMVVGLIAGGQPALTTSIEEIEDSEQEGVNALRESNVTARDAVVGLAASGRTPYVLGAVRYARQEGALTIGVACNQETALEAAVEIAITPLTGPEVISGSTRLKAGTAQKMVLNMLSTGAMVLLGKTMGNLMVDLKPSNSKLRARSIRIVREVLEINSRDAEALLACAGGSVKVALVMGFAGVEVDEARRLLDENGGKVRVAVEAVRR